MDLQLPKNAVIEKVRRRPLKGGLFNGALGLEIVLKPHAAGAGFEDRFGDVLMELLKVELPRSLPIVRLYGTVNWPDEVLAPFVEALQHYGRQVQIVVSTGREWPSWISRMKNVWLIVQTQDPLCVIPAQEVWYAPATHGDITLDDFVFPVDSAFSKTYMYLDVAGVRLSEDELATFLCQSHHAWCLMGA